MEDFVLQKSDDKVTEAILVCEAALFEDHYVSEKAKTSLVDSIRIFFANLIVKIEDAIKTIVNKIDVFCESESYKRQLLQIRSQVAQNYMHGVRKVDIVDLKKLHGLVMEKNAEVMSLGRKFEKNRYKKAYKIQEDFDKMQKIIHDYDAEIEYCAKTTINIPVQKALKMIDDELRGKSEYLKDMKHASEMCKSMEKTATELLTRKMILGDELVVKHTSLIRRMASTIVGFVRCMILRIITKACVIIG